MSQCPTNTMIFTITFTQKFSLYRKIVLHIYLEIFFYIYDCATFLLFLAKKFKSTFYSNMHTDKYRQISLNSRKAALSAERSQCAIQN